MKSKVVIMIVVLALLVSMLPMSSVLAAKAVPTVLIISHNQTGKTISLVLTPKGGGNPSFFSFKPGYSTDSIAEGVYRYYYQTACGIEVGIWNMTRNRTLTTYCAKEGREVNLHSLTPPTGR